jgi:hypothetical protein
MRIIALIVLLTSSIAAAAETEEPEPETVVAGMFEALQGGEWEKAVSFIDIAGIVEEARAYLKKALEQAPAEKKEEMQKEIDGLTEEKTRAEFVKNIESTFGEGFQFKIVDSKTLDENRVVVFVELSRNGRTRTDSIPLVKIDGAWLVSFRGLVPSNNR